MRSLAQHKAGTARPIGEERWPLIQGRACFGRRAYARGVTRLSAEQRA